jgi:hypothetical protein
MPCRTRLVQPPRDRVDTLLEVRERLRPADHQTHRRYSFFVPPGCAELRLSVSYTPKVLPALDSARLVAEARRRQAASLAARIGARLAERWSAELDAIAANAPVSNLLTISLDDASGRYRGAAHRHAPRQTLVVGPWLATPGLLAGPLEAGDWRLTLSAHTLVSPHCDVSIQIGAVTPSSSPRAVRRVANTAR